MLIYGGKEQVSAMFRIKIAELIIRIDNKYEYVSNFCEQYKVKTEKEDFAVSATEEEILKEQRIGMVYSAAYCESLCLYRGICLKIISYDAFLMHSAVLEMDGEAYVFAAKSGTGKTTHLKLWMQEFGDRVRVVNGDKPVYRFLDGVLYAFGTPWCGKEELGNNIKSPVKGIAFLEQSPENSIRRMGGEEVVGRIFHQLLMPCEEETVTYFLKIIDQVITGVRCYLLRCNVLQESARIAYQAMKEQTLEGTV